MLISCTLVSSISAAGASSGCAQLLLATLQLGRGITCLLGNTEFRLLFRKDIIANHETPRNVVHGNQRKQMRVKSTSIASPRFPFPAAERRTQERTKNKSDFCLKHNQLQKHQYRKLSLDCECHEERVSNGQPAWLANSLPFSFFVDKSIRRLFEYYVPTVQNSITFCCFPLGVELCKKKKKKVFIILSTYRTSRRSVCSGRPSSCLLFSPPGCGMSPWRRWWKHKGIGSRFWRFLIRR